jgi:hypothetical protein
MSKEESIGGLDEISMSSQGSKLAKLMLILFDADTRHSSSQNRSEAIFKRQLDFLEDKLVNCNRYIYMSSERIERAFVILNSMVTLVNSKAPKSFSVFHFFVVSLFLSKCKSRQKLNKKI